MRPHNRVGGTATKIGNTILVKQIICRFWHLQVCDAFFWISWILNLPPGIYSRENDQDVFSILWKLNILTIYGGLMKTTSNIHIWHFWGWWWCPPIDQSFILKKIFFWIFFTGKTLKQLLSHLKNNSWQKNNSLTGIK